MKKNIVSQLLKPDYIETHLDDGTVVNLPYLIDVETGEEYVELLPNPEYDTELGYWL